MAVKEAMRTIDLIFQIVIALEQEPLRQLLTVFRGGQRLK